MEKTVICEIVALFIFLRQLISFIIMKQIVILNLIFFTEPFRYLDL